MALNDTFPQAYKTAFADTVYELTQQTKARLRQIVQIEPLQGEQKMFNRLGSVEVHEINGRFEEIVPANIEWDRRRMNASRVGVAMFVDEWDAEKMMMDPQSPLAKRAAEALERHFDRTVVKAALDTVYTGKDGTVAISAATDGVVQVNAQAGLTYDKLLEVDEKFQSKEVGTEMPIRKFLLITEQEHTRLMKEGTLVSGDFSRQYVVDKGQMTRALDFELIVYGSKVPNPILKEASGVRSCLAIAMDAIKIGITKDWDIRPKDVNDRWYTTQILASGIIGGLRMEGVRIIEVQTTVV